MLRVFHYYFYHLMALVRTATAHAVIAEYLPMDLPDLEDFDISAYFDRANAFIGESERALSQKPEVAVVADVLFV